MRGIGTLHPTDGIPAWPDTCHVFVTSAASSAYAVDLPAVAPIPRFMEIISDAAGWICLGSTGAFLPSSNVTTTPSTAPLLQRFAANVPFQRQVVGLTSAGTTGYSIAIGTSANVAISFWGA